ncbi:MAG: tRNA glutamyl-Q(34) synthetase GluQRS [Proteobacteria bacterium]|nr:MAG: tRNA glutamyl-Q(34) synthetase GluQRS [Pseudomonadota bacterium]
MPTENAHVYRGRFAPTPTGPLHSGSLVTALASYLDAKHHNGTWLIRIEDIDPLREMPEASKHILDTLEKHHLFPDEAIVFQSGQNEYYQHLLTRLESIQAVYPCKCSRSELKKSHGRHTAGCRNQPLPARSACTGQQDFAIRFKLESQVFSWQDRVCDRCTFRLQKERDDFVVKRKEGFFAYQLAVVADDIQQHITHIVRGQDLLDNTPMQLALYQALGIEPPIYGHTPLVVNEQNQKLSKQNRARAIATDSPRDNLVQALTWLDQPVPNRLKKETVASILEWAVEHWNIARLKQISCIRMT